MNMFKPSVLTLLMLSTLLTACSTMSDKKLPPVEEILKRPQAVKPQVAVVPTPDGRRGGVLPVLSVINKKGRVGGVVCRDQSAGTALCKTALAQKRPKRYKPAQTCSDQTDANGEVQSVCQNVPSYAEHIYLLYGENDNYEGGLYRRMTIPYPPAAWENGDEGKVILGGVVSPEGKLESIKVIERSGSRWLDNAARKGAMGGIFLPNVKNGKPVWTEFRMPITFHLQDQDVQN
ncbi:MAG: energy transducer TonB [Neisseria sp.]|nr:energy transducer TonB [Neisseria sp.]